MGLTATLPNHIPACRSEFQLRYLFPIALHCQILLCHAHNVSYSTQPWDELTQDQGKLVDLLIDFTKFVIDNYLALICHS